jgi:hypothetical protein
MKDIGILACVGVLLYTFTPKPLPLATPKKVEQETAAPVAATFQR